MFLKYFSFDSWERWPPNGGVCVLSLTAWRVAQACFGGWVGFVGGFSVLSSDCQKRRLFPVLNLRNSKSWRTRNLNIIIAQNFRRIIGCVIRVIYYKTPHPKRKTRPVSWALLDPVGSFPCCSVKWPVWVICIANLLIENYAFNRRFRLGGEGLS